MHATGCFSESLLPALNMAAKRLHHCQCRSGSGLGKSGCRQSACSGCVLACFSSPSLCLSLGLFFFVGLCPPLTVSFFPSGLIGSRLAPSASSAPSPAQSRASPVPPKRPNVLHVCSLQTKEALYPNETPGRALKCMHTVFHSSGAGW